MSYEKYFQKTLWLTSSGCGLEPKPRSKFELFVTYSHRIEAYPGLPKASKMETFTKLFDS